jgi:hypothetical protein
MAYKQTCLTDCLSWLKGPAQLAGIQNMERPGSIGMHHHIRADLSMDASLPLSLQHSLRDQAAWNNFIHGNPPRSSRCVKEEKRIGW